MVLSFSLESDGEDVFAVIVTVVYSKVAGFADGLGDREPQPVRVSFAVVGFVETVEEAGAVERGIFSSVGYAERVVGDVDIYMASFIVVQVGITQ